MILYVYTKGNGGHIMKYDHSEIMKRAWKIVKKADVSFATALKFSWACAKKELSLKESWNYKLPEDAKVSFNIWTGHGRVRAYYRCSWLSNYANSGKKNFVEM